MSGSNCHRKMMHFLAVFVFASLYTVQVNGLRCLTCDEVDLPMFCTHLTTCDANELCGVEKLLNRDGLVKYNLGCTSAKICIDYKNLTSSRQTKTSHHGSTECQDCCDSDLCNSAGCGESGYPSDVGPVCFDCENAINPDRCTKINVCGQNEICYIEEKVIFHVKTYNMKCQRKHICDAVDSGPEIIGRKKRSLPFRQRRSSTVCLSCCNSNLCNYRCGKSHETQTPQVPKTKPSSPKTTAMVPTTRTTTIPTTTQSPGFSGRRFLFAFLKNVYYSYGQMQCLITAKTVGSLEIKVPFLNIFENRTLQSGQNIVNLSFTVQGSISVIENKAIYFESTTDVNVYAMNIHPDSSDGFYVIPQYQLSTEYVIVSEEPYSSDDTYNSEVLVAATQNNTSIRFKLNTNGAVMYRQQSYDNNRDLNITLNQYETFQIEHNHDLTGTVITSSHPIAVISGNKCGKAILSSGCSHLSEMVPPVSSLGKQYIIPIFQAQSVGDHYIRILCTRSNTRVNYTIKGMTQNANLNQSQSISKLVPKKDFMFSTATKPVLVSVSVAASSDNGPFMIIVPGIDKFLSNYSFAVPSAGFNTSGNIIIEYMYASGLYLDGHLINRSCSLVKTAFFNNQYCLMEILLTPGYHQMHQVTGRKFGLFVFGLRGSDGYGFSAGMNLGK